MVIVFFAVTTLTYYVTLNESVMANSCSLSVPIGVSVVVSFFTGALAGLFAGMCFSKRRSKTAADRGKFPPSSVEEPENSSKTAEKMVNLDRYIM